MKQKELPLEIALRLDAIVENLNICKKWTGEKEQIEDIVSACMEKIDYLIKNIEPKGEVFANVLSKQYQVKFEEIKNISDIDFLEEYYLRGKKEIGFIRILDEIHSNNIDAWLLKRLNAKSTDFDRWVAVLNLTKTEDRAYWNRFHELGHRLAEPPQQILPFRREEINKNNPLEKLIDEIAGNLAFHPKLFTPHIQTLSNSIITFNDINIVRNNFAPSASLLATTNAIVKISKRPALAFTASLKKKVNRSKASLALRVCCQARNIHARNQRLFLFPNMRVPKNSCVYETYETGKTCLASENLNIWTTSDGKSLPNLNVTISAIKLIDRIYGIMII